MSTRVNLLLMKNLVWSNRSGAHYVSATDTPVDLLAARIRRLDVVYEATGASQLSFGVIEQVGLIAFLSSRACQGTKVPSTSIRTLS